MAAFDHTFEPKVARVRRLEVLSGDLGRRRWSDETKAGIVRESLQPGVVVSAVARRHGLRPQQLFTWRRLVRAGRLALSLPEPIRFVPVVAEAGPCGASLSSPAAPVRAGVIEIEIGGAIVRVGAEVDVRRLVRVLRALRAAK